MKKYLRFCGQNPFIPLLFAVFLLKSFPVTAQYPHWTRCDTGYVGPNGFLFNTNSRFGGLALMAPYFVNPQIGYAYEPDVVDNGMDRRHPRLYRTKDSAQTWQLCDTNTITGGITYMCFPTPGHGYLATAFDTGKVTKIPVGGIYETTDTGYTWTQISPSGDFSQVWATGKTLFAVQSYTGNISLMTTNDGRSWTDLGDSIFYITGDGNNYVVLYEETEANIPFLKYSTDDGLTWAFDSLLGGIVGQDEPLCFPGTYTLLDLDDNLNPPLIRQLNLQDSWDSLPDLDSVANEEVILDDAEGCSVYGEMSNNQVSPRPQYGLSDLIRSTDLGTTWKIIPSPTLVFGPNAFGPTDKLFNLETEFSVTGNGAVVYLIDDSGFMWRTMDGGDGAMANYVLYTVSLNPHLPSGSHGDTIFTTLCDSTSFLYTFQYVGACSSSSLDSVSIVGLDTSQYRLTRTYHTPSENVPDTSWIAIHSSSLGTRKLTIHSTYLNTDKEVVDTSFSLVLDVGHNPGTLSISPTTPIDFGTQALCSPVTITDSVRLSASGCESITVDSIVFIPLNEAPDFSFSRVGSITIVSGSQKRFPISFKPSIADTERGKVFVYWFDGETQHVDTIETQGVGVTDTRTFTIHTDTLSLRMCDSTTGTVLFTNTTCGTLTLDSLTPPNGVTFAPGMNPSFPLVLAPGASDSLVVHLALGDPGTSVLQIGDTVLQAVAHVQFTEHGSSSTFDTTLSLNIRVGGGIPAATLSTPSLNFGSVSTCGGSVTLPVLLSSTGCDTLTCNSTSPSTPFILTKSFSSVVPIGVVDTALVTFTPTQSGPFDDTLVITTNAGTETVPLQGVGIAGASILSVDTTPRDFGALYACETRDTSITLYNTGCDTLFVDSASLSNSTYTTDTTFPLMILPRDSVTLRIFLTGDTSGMNGTLEFFSNANQGSSTATIPLSASNIQPGQLHLSLSAPQSGKNQKVVTFYLILNGTGSVDVIDSLHFDLSHNDDLLSFESESGVSIQRGMPVHGMENDTFVWHGVPIMPDTIGTLTYQVYLTDSSSTPLTLSNISFGNPLGLPNDCIASIDDSGSGFTYIYQCGEGFIQDAMLEESPFTIASIVPNPAQDEITIQLSGILQPEVEMYDALGRGMDVRSTSLQSGIVLDVTNVPSGIYFIRLSAGGFVESRSVVIQK